MKIEYAYPPNIDKIRAVLDVSKPTIVYTYKDTLYAPHTKTISADLMAHEETHMRQQEEMGADEWWDEYLANPKFRLGVEVEAYHNQYQAIQSLPRDHKRFITRHMIRALCSPMYGRMVDKTMAARLIKEGLWTFNTANE